MAEITIFILIPSQSGVSEAWLNHLAALSNCGINVVLVTAKKLADSEDLKGLNVGNRASFSEGQSPYVQINDLIQQTGNGFFTIIKPGHFINISRVEMLTAFLKEEESGHKLGLAMLQYCNDEHEAFASISDLSEEKPAILNYAAMLYDPPLLRPQLVWHFSAHEQLGFFRTDLNMLAEQEFYLRSLKRGQSAVSALLAGRYWLTAEECTADYRQAYYEEELALKEEYIRFVLSSDYAPNAPLANELALHAKMVSFFLQKLQDGKDIPIDEFERHLFIYALLAVKNGALKDAKDILYMFFSLRGRSRNCAHLYRIILTPFLSAPPEIRPATREKPLVSIPMALYNQGHYLEGALRSIFAQTLTDWEVVIINDGSTDNSLRIAKDLLKKYNDPRMRIISKANEGLPKTRTRGMLETTAQYICQLDSDDFIAPEYLERAVAILETEPDVGWVTPKSLMFGGSNHLVWFWEYDFVFSLIKCPSPALALFRRSMWEEVGGYRDDMPCREDWEFWIRAGEHGWRGKTMDEVMFLYRHAFSRWGEQNKYNISSKMGIINHHPWWYRKLPGQQLMEMLLAHKVGEFPKEILDKAVIEKVRPFFKYRQLMRQKVEILKYMPM